MNFPYATISELLSLAEAVENMEMKKSFHSTIVKRVYNKQLAFDDEDDKMRFNKLSTLIYNQEDLFFFAFVTDMLNRRQKRKRPICTIIDARTLSNDDKKSKPNEIISIEKSDDKNKNVNILSTVSSASAQMPSTSVNKIDQSSIKTIHKITNETEVEIVISESEEEVFEILNSDDDNSFDNNKQPEDCDNELSNASDMFDDLEHYSIKDISDVQCAFDRRIRSFKIYNKNKKLLFANQFLFPTKKIILSKIEIYIKELIVFKINVTICTVYSKLENMIKSTNTKSFTAPSLLCTQSSDCDKIIYETFEYLNNISEEFQDSGWSLEEILSLQVNVNKYNPLRASSFIALPQSINRKSAVINVQNEDEKCFQWAILSGLHFECYLRDKEFVKTYAKPCVCGKTLDFNFLRFPVDLKQIPQFEKLNGISINVFGIEGIEIVGPLHHTLEKKPQHFNLLLIKNDSGDKSHYCYIKSMSRLLSTPLTKYKSAKFVCDGCLAIFYCQDKLNKHSNGNCSKVVTILPAEDSKISTFNNWSRSVAVRKHILNQFI